MAPRAGGRDAEQDRNEPAYVVRCPLPRSVRWMQQQTESVYFRVPRAGNALHAELAVAYRRAKGIIIDRLPDSMEHGEGARSFLAHPAL
jgi:hypothetical protein